MLVAFASLWPAAKAGAQSGRKRTAQPSATPRQSTQQQQRQRRAVSSTSASERAPAQVKPTAAAPPVNVPLTDAPPPWPTPTPAPASSAPSTTKTGETEAGEEVDEADVVRINSNLVTVPASVVDASGRAVIDLKLEDFELRVDGQPKEISELGRSETPVRMVMLFDNSMSISAAREFEKKAAVKFFRSVLRPIDQAAIYSIWTIPIFVQPFTNDVRTLVRTIENFDKPEEGATALFDTVAQAAEYLRPYQGRKVVIIVSDGADTLSNMDFLTSLKKVMTADVQVYAVQTGQLENANLYNLAAHHRLQEYTSQTGGAVYVPRYTSDLDVAFAQISADLAQQYVLSYYPQDDRNDGRFRTISLRIKTRPNMRVRARKGYYDRIGQKQGSVPAESMNVTVNQPESARPQPSNGTTQSVAPNTTERREPASANNAAPRVSRRASGGSSVGPPGPDDEPERPARADSGSTGFAETPAPDNGEKTATPTATPAPTPSQTQPQAAQPAPKKPLTGGVLNGKALDLPRPVYPPAAKSMGVAGTVIVEVLIDESGRVISARAVSGPSLLHAAAVQAARQAKFSPTMLSGQPTQVSGTITYSFVRP